MNNFTYKVTIADKEELEDSSLELVLQSAKDMSVKDFPHHYAVWVDDAFVVAIAYGGNLIFDDTKNQQARERAMEQTK